MEAVLMKTSSYYSSYYSSVNDTITAYWIAGIIGGIIWGIIWGCITNSIMKNKGYTGGGWFWLGAFLGFIGLIIALTKPDVSHYSSRPYTENKALQNFKEYEARSAYNSSDGANGTDKPGTVRNGVWRCRCGNYTSIKSGVCSMCGTSLSELRNDQLTIASASNYQIPHHTASNSDDSIEKIKKYKELLDIGAITEEEYNIKKKELLGFSNQTTSSGNIDYPDNIIDVTIDTDDELPPL